MNIGIVGAGAIARFLLKEVNQRKTEEMQVSSLFVRNRKKHEDLERHYGAELFENLDAFLASNIDIVVEAATVETVHALLPKILPEKDAVIISIGALSDVDFFRKMNELAETYGRRVHLPSGAIGGLDLLQNAHAAGGVTSVSLTTRKPASTLMDNPIPANETVVFEGYASEAIKQFPKNINVSIILSLAGLGVNETNVTIIADPTIDNNIHTVDIKGDFGTASVSVENNPLPENPKTSHLAAMSILGTLQRITKRFNIGI